MAAKQQIDPNGVSTVMYDWGVMKWLVTPKTTPGAEMTFGEVILLPDKGHERHNHPTSEEILYVVNGSGEMMIDGGAPFAVKAGDTIYIPTGVFHSSHNTGWGPLHLLAMYNPGGPEQVLPPGHEVVPAGEAPRLSTGVRA